MTTQKFTRRHAAVIGLSAALVGGFGCATVAVGSGSTKTNVIEGAVVLSDDIVAFGRPDEAMVKSMGKTDAIAFLGTANTYLLVEGGETLLSMAKLDPARLTLTTDNHKLFLKDKTVWGTLEFSYASDLSAATTDEEKATLKALRFIRNTPKSMMRTVSIKAAVYPAIKVQGTAFTEMKNTRKLSFRAPSSTETTPNLGKIALLPAAIVVDVLTAPLQLLGAGVLLLSIGH